MSTEKSPEKSFEQSAVFKKIKIGFCVVLGLLLIADFFIPKEHAMLPGETIPGFYALFGLLATTLIILVAKLLGHLFIMKKEDFYND